MTQLNAVGATQAGPRTLPLTAPAAKRLMGVLGVSEWPVRWAGNVALAVQRKRHPYDEWTTLKLAAEIDPTNSSLRYRVVVQ